MTAQEIINLSVAGELKSLAIKSDTTAVIGFLNLGLIELYKKFSLSTKEYVVTLVGGVTNYTMPNDFMWLVGAYEHTVNNDGSYTISKLMINEADNSLSINMTGWNTVQIPFIVPGYQISLTYVAQPVLVTEATLNSIVEIPAQLIAALLSYMAYRAFLGVDGKQQSEQSNHYKMFELEIQKVVNGGMITTDNLSMYERIKNKGFV